MSKQQSQAIGWRCQSALTTLVTVLFAILPAGFAQEAGDGVFYFENRVDLMISSFNSITPKSHFLGEELGKKDAVFHDLYSYMVSGHVTTTGQQVVVGKPVIFNSVKKTSRYYRKLLKQKQITEVEAKEKVNHLLDVAISVFTQSTTAFEDELKRIKEPVEIARLYERVVLR
ncbi:MAG: hypothetical protein IH597_13880 [Bacteroidales bacterium]|nr:hypothetical protein [Bacteroidales bacterium]